MTVNEKQHCWAVDVSQLGASYEGYMTEEERSEREWDIQYEERECYVLNENDLEKFLTRLREVIDRRNEKSLEGMVLKALDRSTGKEESDE
mgnify:CR=1 FL=1|jgi:hypothetical protein|tara:strand:- start:416 stop:688 length:273 start_codon:yes stop_codon:yes gene_type:complete